MAGPVTMATSLLLLALCIAPADSVTLPSSCCITFISKKIPESRVISYQLTNRSICPQAGVIFTTRKGQKFCGNPKLPWVQKYVKNLDAKQKKASTRTRATSTTAPFWRHPDNSTFI
ncbi:C-C motif chemokine 24 [Bubalus kerabau]|uniref:C-C motif chemokine 24 n=1 Tax=Bubalus bubalis TaxID=89462 RepID=UPI00042CB45E|nr:C-C motif chemokine 24 [Bubalus bubalis]XP_044791692.1 C-C motif chemokine 24 [Bubalus bubalis]XP_055417486.1 C-C motif chemokine 24 [Bubalus carabanensis]